MANDIKIQIEAILNDSRFKAGVKSMSAEMDSHAKKSGGFFSQLKLGWLAVVGVVYQVGKALKGFVVEAMEAQTNVTKLSQALVNQGTYSKELVKAYQDQAKALQALTKFGDDEIVNAQAILTTYGAQKENMEELVKATLDFAEAKKIDLRSASEIVGKTIGSENNLLGRYGVQIDNAKKGTDRMTETVNKLNMMFGGQAESAAKTFEGRIKQVQNQMKDFQETLGKGILIGLNPMIEKFEKFSKSAKGMEQINNMAKTLASAFVVVGGAIGIVVNNIVGMVNGAIDGIRTIVSSGQAVMKWIKGEGSPKEIFETMKSGAIETAQTYKDTVQGIFESIGGIGQGLKDLWTETETLIVESNLRIGESNEELLTKTTEQINKEKEERLKFLEFMDEQKVIELEKLEEQYNQQLAYADKYGADLALINEQYQMKQDEINKKYDAEYIKGVEAKKKAEADFLAFKEGIIQSSVDALIDGIADEKKAGKKATADYIRMIGTQIAGMLTLKAAASFATLATIPQGIAYTAAAAGVKVMANGVANQIESYDVGTPSIAGDQVAMVHDGERIIPADMNIPNISNEDFIKATYRGLGSNTGSSSVSTTNNNNTTNVNLNGLSVNAGMNTTIGELINMADRMGMRSIFQRG